MTKQPEPPTLQPIEDAPLNQEIELRRQNGTITSVSIWKKIARNDWMYKLPGFDWETSLSTDNEIQATHFTLWPKTPKPKTTWDEYEDKHGDFDGNYVNMPSPHHFDSVDMKKVLAEVRAVVDYAKNFYPITQDNE